MNPFFKKMILSGLAVGVYADLPTGLIGGQDLSSDAYAAFVASGGGVSPVSGLPIGGDINSVAINLSGEGLIGGVQASGCYAAYTEIFKNLNFIVFYQSGSKRSGMFSHQI
jgi:hypothetical protein